MAPADPRRLPRAAWFAHQLLPTLLGGSMALVVHRITGRPLAAAGVAVLMAGIAAAYGLDRLLDPPDRAASRRLRPVLLASLAMAAAAGLWALPRLAPPSLALLLLLGALALGYRRWKRLPFAKTLLVPVVWTWALLALPAPDGSWFGWRTFLDPAAIPLLLLFSSGCLLCDLKDVDRDRAAGIPSLPVRIGPGRARAVAVGLAAGALAWAVPAQRYGLACSSAALLLLNGFPRLLERDALGPALVDLALALSGLLILTRLV